MAYPLGQCPWETFWLCFWGLGLWWQGLRKPLPWHWPAGLWLAEVEAEIWRWEFLQVGELLKTSNGH